LAAAGGRRGPKSKNTPATDFHPHDGLRPLNVDSSRSTQKIFYTEPFATTIRTVSGLSRQTPSMRIPKISRIENVSLSL
jgi:hypothetical protein